MILAIALAAAVPAPVTIEYGVEYHLSELAWTAGVCEGEEPSEQGKKMIASLMKVDPTLAPMYAQGVMARQRIAATGEECAGSYLRIIKSIEVAMQKAKAIRND